jgi:hypothetical protein
VNNTRLIYFLQTGNTSLHLLPYCYCVTSKQLSQIEKEMAEKLKEEVNLNSP